MEQPTRKIIAQVSHFILGKEQQIKLALACLLARGHKIQEKQGRLILVLNN